MPPRIERDLNELDLDSDSMADVTAKIAEVRAKHNWEPERVDPQPELAPREMSAEEIRERDEANRRREEQRDQAERQAAVHSLISGAGSSYAECRLRTFKAESPFQKRVVAHMQSYIDNFARHIAENEGLILYGPVGTGKDHLAFSVAGAAAWEGKHSAKWVNGQSWFGRVRDAMDKDISEHDLIDEMRRPEILVLSDPLPPIGPLSQHQATMLYRMIDARYRCKNRVTIVTVNVADDAEADERIGAPTWDRLCHNAIKVNCRWATYRKPKLVITPNK